MIKPIIIVRMMTRYYKVRSYKLINITTTFNLTNTNNFIPTSTYTRLHIFTLDSVHQTAD